MNDAAWSAFWTNLPAILIAVFGGIGSLFSFLASQRAKTAVEELRKGSIKADALQTSVNANTALTTENSHLTTQAIRAVQDSSSNIIQHVTGNTVPGTMSTGFKPMDTDVFMATLHGRNQNDKR